MTLEHLRTFSVGKATVEQTEVALSGAGAEGHELFVLWSGNVVDDEFVVAQAHVPKQTSYRLPDGLSVRVDGDELHRLNVWLFEHGQTLGAQVHAHPGSAYHSATDDTYPIVTTLGGLSIVAASFCSQGLVNRRTRYYRLTERGWARQRRKVLRVT